MPVSLKPTLMKTTVDLREVTGEVKTTEIANSIGPDQLKSILFLEKVLASQKPPMKIVIR